jgi:hypothetical protein
MYHPPQTRFRRQRGQSLLETAMMIVVIFTVVFWIFELGWVMYTRTSLHDVSGLPPASVTFPEGSSAPPHLVRVTVSYTYVPWLKQFINTPTMTTYAEGRMIVP